MFEYESVLPGLTIYEAGSCLSFLLATIYFATAAELLTGNICSILWKILLWNWKGCLSIWDIWDRNEACKVLKGPVEATLDSSGLSQKNMPKGS